MCRGALCVFCVLCVVWCCQNSSTQHYTHNNTYIYVYIDRAEALLPRCVPDLQLDGLPVLVQGADLEIDADGADVALRVSVVGEAEEQARLAHARVADEKKLEEVIVPPKTCLFPRLLSDISSFQNQ